MTLRSVLRDPEPAPGGGGTPAAAPPAAPASLLDAIKADLSQATQPASAPQPNAASSLNAANAEAPALPTPSPAPSQEPSFDAADDDFKFSDEEPVTSATTGVPQGEESTAPPPAPASQSEAEAQAALQAAIDAGVPDPVKQAFLKTNQGRRMLRAHDLVRELEAPIESGGLGFQGFTRDDIRGWLDSHNFVQSFSTAINSNDPTRVTAAWSELIGDPTNGYLPGVEQAIGHLPVLLQKQSPQLYYKMAAPVAAEVAERIVGFIRALPDGDPKSPDSALQEAAAIKAGWIEAGQKIEELLFGRSRGREQFYNQSRRISEAEALRQENARLKQEQQQQREQAVQAQRDGFHSSFNSLVMSKATGWAKEALQPLAKQYGETSWQFTAAVEKLADRAVDAIIGDPSKGIPGNDYLIRQLSTALQSSWQTGKPEDVFKIMRNPLQDVIRNMRASFLRNGSAAPNGANALTDNADLHRAHQTASNGNGATGSGRPVQQSVVPGAPALERRPDETQGDFLTRAIRDDLERNMTAIRATRR